MKRREGKRENLHAGVGFTNRSQWKRRFERKGGCGKREIDVQEA